jgi:hypothetical protein
MNRRDAIKTIVATSAGLATPTLIRGKRFARAGHRHAERAGVSSSPPARHRFANVDGAASGGSRMFRMALMNYLTEIADHQPGIVTFRFGGL